MLLYYEIVLILKLLMDNISEQRIRKIIKKYGIKTSVIADGIGMNKKTLNAYLSHNGIPPKHLIQIKEYLRKNAMGIIEDIIKL